MTKIMKGGIAYNATSNMVALTQAEYNALSTAQKNNGNFYFITDADPSYFSAENIDYDNTDSGLSATDIQGAIDEVAQVERLKTITTGTIIANSTGGWSLSTVCCNKVLNIVSICFEATKSSALDSGWNTMGTLPSGFRPSSDIYVSFIDAQNDFGTYGKINSSGQIQVYKTSSMSTRERGSATYIVSS